MPDEIATIVWGIEPRNVRRLLKQTTIPSAIHTTIAGILTRLKVQGFVTQNRKAFRLTAAGEKLCCSIIAAGGLGPAPGRDNGLARGEVLAAHRKLCPLK